jgi:NADH dehydrogenase FAD-containing subunit
MKRLLLLGGGHAHVEVLRAFAAQRCSGCEIVVVTPYTWLTYSGMVPGFVAGH